MKKLLLLLLSSCCFTTSTFAQGLHFSQYYNAPMLLNPANTGLIQDYDWRAGINYRNQGATIPIPYNTSSVFADVALLKNKLETSWIGAGLAVWHDVAGKGDLALTKIQTNLAYHVLLSEKSSLSAGLYGSFNQRSVDFSKLTFDRQWDEFSFNTTLPSGETNTTQKTTFFDLGTGMNFAFYNNSNFYLKASVAAMHINQPLETFYGESNKIGLRPQLNLEIIYKAGGKIMLTPSVYYTRQKKANELVTGTLVNINASNDISINSNELILGTYLRNKDAIIAVAGYKFGNNKFMFSYDHTISQLAQGNNGVGAFELSLILQGNFKRSTENSKTYGCPRF
jgi:type IX secretion system PorP/SprF family membrane protein